MPLTIFSTATLGNANSDHAAVGSRIASAFADRCSILRSNGAADDMGGYADNWVTIASEVPCRAFRSLVGAEGIRGESLTSTQTWTMQLPIGTDIQPPDRIVKDDITYDVTDTDLGITNEIYLTVMLVQHYKQRV